MNRALAIALLTAAAPLGCEHLIARRVENDAGNDLAILLKADCNVIYRKSVCEVCRAVKRIHVPLIA